MNIQPTKDFKLIKEIVTNKRLYEQVGHTIDAELYKPNENDLWLEIKDEDKTIGLFHLKEFNKITFDAHIYILPKYQKTLYPINSVILAQEWIRNNTQKRKVITTVPIKCTHVLLFLKHTNAKVAGRIKDGIILKDNRLQDLILFEFDLYETETQN